MVNVIEYLKDNNINFKLFEHPAVFTCEEAEKYTKDVKGIHLKNLFLKDRKSKRFYLVIMPHNKRLDMKHLSEVLEDNLKFANEDNLKDILNLNPGSVSVFGLLNDKENQVKLIIHKDVVESEYVSFHPNINTQTLEIQQKEFEIYLKIVGNEFEILEF